MRNIWWAKTLRIIGIILLSLTAAFTLMGGAGSTCVAVNPTGFGGKFAGIAPFQWLWFVFVIVGIIAGILGIRAVVLIIKGVQNAYRAAMIALLIGTVVNVIHLLASRALRGGSMPVDGVLYANVLTLIFFLTLRIPGIWQAVNFEKPSETQHNDNSAASIALASAGLLTLSIQYLMLPTHTINGINYADACHTILSVIGGCLILSAVFAMLYSKASAAFHSFVLKGFINSLLQRVS